LLISGGIKKFGSRSAPDGSEHIEAIVADRRLTGCLLAAPFRNEAIEPDRIDHRAGENMRADLGALFHHDDGDVRRELLEPDRGGEPGRPGADDDDVELHRLAGGKLRCVHGWLRNSRDGRWFFTKYMG
jgi:hypothetical protein